MKLDAFIATLLCAGLAGCATTGLDQAGKEQAKLTLSMLAVLDDASKDFSAEHSRSVAYLNRASADQRAGLQRAREVIAREQAAAAAVADEKALTIQKRMLPLVASIEYNAASRKTVEELETETKALLKPLPRLTQSVADSKKAVAALIEDVPTEVRLKELQAYLAIAHKNLKDAKEKLNAAESESATPP